MSARLTPTEIEAIRKRHEVRIGSRDVESFDSYATAVADVAALLADRDATMEVGTVDEIAAIVCKHVPPVRLCDRGETCSCWAEYALPAAREILARFQLVPAPPSPTRDTVDAP